MYYSKIRHKSKLLLILKLTSSLVDLSCLGGVVGWPAWLNKSGSTELVRDPLPSLAPLG